MNRLTRTYFNQKPKVKKDWNTVQVYQYGKCIGDFKTPALANDFIRKHALKNTYLIFVNI